MVEEDVKLLELLRARTDIDIPMSASAILGPFAMIAFKSGLEWEKFVELVAGMGIAMFRAGYICGSKDPDMGIMFPEKQE